MSTKQSPHFKAFYRQYPVNITLDTGAEISMIKSSVAQLIGAVVKKTTQSALQADGITPLAIVGETHISLTRDNIDCQPTSDTQSTNITHVQTPAESRPRREIKRPKYLDDYILK